MLTRILDRWLRGIGCARDGGATAAVDASARRGYSAFPSLVIHIFLGQMLEISLANIKIN